ncbi:MAG: antitoxin AF2212-like protein [Cyanobacteria bacterium P01_E01_bin.42]
MVKTITAVFDGKVFHPTDAISLPPNTSVEITIQTVENGDREPVSFLEVARSFELEGPTDWSENLDRYL